LGDGNDSNGLHKGFIYSGGQYTELLPPGWINARFYFINNNEEVVGEVDCGSGLAKFKRGFIYRDGEYTFFVPDGMSDISVTGINDSGEVVGSAQDPDSFTDYGFVYRNGRFTYLPTWVIPCGINNKGVVVGHAGYYRDGVQGFIATPVTTPQ
jgi:probable HAF family extracellular repeat protein